MEDILYQIEALYGTINATTIERIEQLPQSGGDRIYFRIYTGEATYIATYDTNIAETETFLYCTHHFTALGLPVPEIFAVNEERTIYLQQDFGTQSLLDKLEADGHTDEVFGLYQQALQQLSRMQLHGHQGFDYNKCLTAKAFGRQAIMSDLLYFKYYFLDTLKLPYDKQAMMSDFETLASHLDGDEEKYFLYRDFQSRNIMVQDGKVHFIDYQGGMNGALQYDVASMLWQAKANLPQAWKEQLLHYYIGETEKNLQRIIDQPLFISRYYGYVLIRLLQVLGAYGFRGLFERRAHFLTSIPQALRNLAFFLQHHGLDLDTPELNRMLQQVASDEIIQRFQPVRATAETPLVIKIYSFSYKQELPTDDSGNGGGFLFDMRGILNPGRFEEYKKLTGRDKEVKDFLEQKTSMTEYLHGVFDVVDITVTDYIQRGFASLMVGFGCTGGQHRSVYAADALNRHLRNKFGVKTEIHHLVQDAKSWIN